MRDISQEKQLLRKQIKVAISQISDVEKRHESTMLTNKIAQFINSHPEIRTVASYAANAKELNLDSLPAMCPKVRFCYPKCGNRGLMEFHLVKDVIELKSMTMGIREPNAEIHPQVRAADIDLYLCPAYAFSENGERLGKGGGYYDRYLSHKREDALLVGIAFSCQKLTNSEIPTEAHDLRVDWLL